jgi:DNA-binding FrmR family transcriptional regulator
MPNKSIEYKRLRGKMVTESVKINTLARMKRIEGQIRGIQKMIENDRYCIEIVDQITAARKALCMASLIVIKGHVDECVTDAIRAGNSDKKIDELIGTLYKFVK